MVYEEKIESRSSCLTKCPHCARVITGRDVLLLKNISDFEDLIQWTIPCPGCGRMICMRGEHDPYAGQSN